MDTRRRLWIEKDNAVSSKDQRKHFDDNTYDAIFDKFSSRSTQEPLSVLVSKGLVVGQEFILSCLLLASHRVALTEENMTSDSNAIGNSKLPIVPGEVQPSVLLIAWVSFVLIVAFYSKPRDDNGSSSTQHKLRTRIADSIFMAILLRFLAGVLRTLTASYSSDTVHALAIVSLSLHLLACDYNYANGHTDDASFDTKNRPSFQGGTLSLTAVFFATTLLASRLADNVAVYLFVSYSVILFALYPAARHQVGINTQTTNKSGKSVFFIGWINGEIGTNTVHDSYHSTITVPVVMTGLILLVTFLLLQPYEMVFVASVFIVLCGFVPLWIYFLQASKIQLRGPWDIAHVA